MWIKINDPKQLDSEPWIGKISLGEDQKSRWQFELIRGLDGLSEAYAPMSYFNESKSLIGFLDLQRECTLIWPMVTNLDPGSVGVYQIGHRTKLNGQFHALLENAAIEDLDAPSVLGVSIASDSFASWYAKISRSEIENPTSSSMGNYEEEIISIQGLGKITCRYGFSKSMATWEDKEKSYAAFNIDFDHRISVNDSMAWCFELECLFQFLVGLSTKWSKFSLKMDETYQLGSDTHHYFSELTFGKTPCKKLERPHPFECAHNNRRCGADLAQILKCYVADRKNLAERIQAIRYARFMANSLQEKFTTTLPVLEAYLTKTYQHSNEVSFLASQKAFFDWVEKSENSDVLDFSKKHLKVVDTKAPSLKNLILRAMESANLEGYKFSANLSDKIAKRRGRVFHNNLAIDDRDDGMNFQAEVNTIIGILALHTYRDLGLDISKLECGRSGNQEIQWFLKPPSPA